MSMSNLERDRLFVDKVFQYVADPGFDGTVETYLRTMVDEYTAQMSHWQDDLRDIADHGSRYQQARAKRDAYADALRVLDDAVQAALDISMSTPR